MPRIDVGSKEIAELVDQLEKDRAWLLEQIDNGRWPELRLDLAALERELGQLLDKATQEIDEGNNFKQNS